MMMLAAAPVTHKTFTFDIDTFEEQQRLIRHSQVLAEQWALFQGGRVSSWFNISSRKFVVVSPACVGLFYENDNSNVFIFCNYIFMSCDGFK